MNEGDDVETKRTAVAQQLSQDARLLETLKRCDAKIRLDPNSASAHYNRGFVLHSLGRFDEALRSYNQVVRLKPHIADTYYHRGNTLKKLRRLEEALQSYDRAIGLKPDFAEAYCNQGNTLRELKRLDEALASYARAIECKSGYTLAFINRGKALRDVERLDEALESYDRAITSKPDSIPAFMGRAATLQALMRFDEALESYDRAIEIKPDFMEPYIEKGNLLMGLMRFDEALENYDRAIAVKPGFAEAHCNRGNALTKLKRLGEALASYDRAIELNPDSAEIYWNKSIYALLMGNFDEGWPLYEWRKKRASPLGSRKFSQPAWSGRESIEGRTLLIYSEQGLGDTIQFSRYALLAEAAGAKVIFAAHDPLRRLLETLSPAIRIVGLSAMPRDFDYHIALLSMPLAFRTNRTNIPARVPYLRADAGAVGKWRERIGNGGFKVGICWQGSLRAADVGRSFPVSYFQCLAGIPDVRLISLQKNAGVEQLLDLPAGMKVETLGDAFDAGPDAFIDTAAVMECLDLVITADTAPAHLAGALGRPTWVALKHVPDWRWLLDRTDSPWYPTIRLFRQPKRGDWPSVFAAMEAELTDRNRLSAPIPIGERGGVSLE
jgi:tetratricopeptide (TPR) repeat protein